MVGRSGRQRDGLCLPSTKQTLVAFGEAWGLELLVVALFLNLLGELQRSAEKLVLYDGRLTDMAFLVERAR